MAKKKSEKEYLETLHNIHGDKYEYYRFPEKFNQKTKINVLCKKHKTYFSASLNNLSNGHGCPKCGKENMVKHKNLKDQTKYRALIEEYYGGVFDLSMINYNCRYDKDKVSVICKKCGKVQEKTIADLYHRRGGCLCDKKERMDWFYSEIREKEFRKILDFSQDVYGERLDLSESEYINIGTKMKIHCNICDYDFMIKPSNFLYKFQSCPICAAKSSMSSYARAFMYMLEDNNIKFIPEYYYTDDEYLKNKPYDFYIESLNLLVEVDGEQHRRPAFGKTWDDVFKQQEIDRLKKEIGEENGFNVIRLNTDEDFLSIGITYINSLMSSTTIQNGVESSDSK